MQTSQNGKFCSSWLFTAVSPLAFQQMQCLPILFDSSEPSAIFSTFKPAPVGLLSLLNITVLGLYPVMHKSVCNTGVTEKLTLQGSFTALHTCQGRP